MRLSKYVIVGVLALLTLVETRAVAELFTQAGQTTRPIPYPSSLPSAHRGGDFRGGWRYPAHGLPGETGDGAVGLC